MHREYGLKNKETGDLLKSLIDKWQERLESLNYKDRHDSADHLMMGCYKEIIKDLQKL
jgi:hypothetical protein